ncbi:hypothetical protein [Paraneptunicella aestuarii]|uniref:hypothetical protein n=1 Tax=Paraneptunicella aestuarii TaxID=2831148 RepID=UPI001E4FB3A0|nr:hypothetical protein [Paraneptunicella aestuarii]
MSAIPLEKVHGKHLASSKVNNTLSDKHSYSLDKLINAHANVENIQVGYRLEQPIYVVSSDTGQHLYHGITGESLEQLSEQEIDALAQQYYLGDGELLVSKRLLSPPHEASRAKGEVWQVMFDDTWNTTLYIAPDSGKLIHVRSDIWRLFDFVWMLHIMDYETRDDFNNPLLISFAAASVLFTLSGMVLLYRTYLPHFRRRNKK